MPSGTSGWGWSAEGEGVTDRAEVLGYLVQDEFDDDNATTLPNHTPDIAPDGSSWAALFGSGFTVQSNELDCNGPTDQLVTIDCGEADNIYVRLEGITIGQYLGILIRDKGAVGELQAWLLQMHTGNNKVTIAELNGGWTERASDAEAMSPGDTFDSIELRVEGNVITAYVDDVERCSYTSATFNAQSYVGVYGYGENGTWNAERFLCGSL